MKKIQTQTIIKKIDLNSSFPTINAPIIITVSIHIDEFRVLFKNVFFINK